MNDLPVLASPAAVADPLFPGRAMAVAARGARCDLPRLVGRSRRQHIVRARWAVMLALHGRGVPYQRIAHRLQRRCHTTVIYGIDQAKRLVQTDREFAWLVNKVDAA